MANVSNNFTALLGANDALTAKKKKNNKKPSPAVAAPQQATDSSSNAGSAQSNGVAAKPADSGVLDVPEAIAILERAAREAKTMSDKCRLWKEWTRQGADRSGKGIKYRAADGALLDFKQVLLLSKALEITVEASLVSGLSHDTHENLATVLTAFLTSTPQACSSLASQLVRLATLLTDEAPDTLGAAQRAVQSTIASLKAGGTQATANGEADVVTAWISRVENADKEIRKQDALLQKLYATSGGVVTKEQLSCAKAMYKTSEDKLELLKNLPASKAPAKGCKALEDFKSVINSHLKEATAMEDSVKGKTASAETQRVQTLAAYRREEAIVAQEGLEVAGQVRSLEAQLRALKSRQAELEDKRAQLQQRSRQVVDALGSSRPLGGALSSSHYRDEMSVVKALDDLVNPGSQGAPEQILEVQQAQLAAPLEYLSHGQQYLALALSTLVELPSKLNFCKQRLSHADKLAKLVADSGHSKQREVSEKLLSDHMKSADETNRACMQVIINLKQRTTEMSRADTHFAAAAAPQIHAVDALHEQLREAYDAIQVAYLAPLVEAAPAVTNGKPGSGHGRRGGAAAAAAAGNGHAEHSAKAVAAPAPAAAPAAVFDVAAVPAAVAAPAPAAPAPPAAPIKRWGMVEAAVPADSDTSLPTPAEAFKVAVASTSAEGFKDVAPKKNRRKV